MSLLRILLAPLILGLCGAAASAPLTDLDGRPDTLEAHLGGGRWLVVVFWSSDCPVCNREIYQYEDLHALHHDLDARVLGISLDGRDGLEAARAFVRRHVLGFPNLIGEPGAVAELYRGYTGEPFRGTPSLLLFDPEGRLRARQVGAVPRTAIEDFIEQGGA